MWISHHHADHICGFPLLLENINRARILYKRYNLTFNTIKNSKEGEEGLNNVELNYITMKSMNVIDKITVIAPPDVIRYYEYTACISGLEDLVTFVPISATLFAGYMIPLDGNGMYVYICVYVYVYIYLYIYIMCMFYFYLFICICIHKCLCVYSCVCLCLILGVEGLKYIHIYMCIYKHICISKHI
jgi:hypothetical protein